MDLLDRCIANKTFRDVLEVAVLALILAVLHFIWLVKADLREPLVYAGIAALVLAWRIPIWFGRRPLNYATLRRGGKNGRTSKRPSSPAQGPRRTT